MELDYQGDFQATRSARNPATILQSDLLGFATPVTKMEILVTGPRRAWHRCAMLFGRGAVRCRAGAHAAGAAACAGPGRAVAGGVR